MDVESAKVKELWGSSDAAAWRTSKLIHWLEHPRVQERNNLLVSGSRDTNRFEYFIKRYFGKKRARRVLTLGCGHGEFERGLSKSYFARTHDAVDLADGAIEDARTQAKSLGLTHIHYRVADLNTIAIPPCTYDVVFGISSIHHVSNLEHLFDQVVKALKPGGYFFLDEYIGPNKFQWTDSQLAIINDQIHVMPDRMKTSLHDGHLKGALGRQTIAEMDAIDPSEGVRSADILNVLRDYFDILEVRGSGGTILHLLLEGIAGNFSEDDPESMQYLEHLFALEDRLIADGTLKHDFAVIIAKRKPTRVEKILGKSVAYFVSKARSRTSR